MAIVSAGVGGHDSAAIHQLARSLQMGAKVMIARAEVSDERGEALAFQSRSPLGSEKRLSTVIVMEHVSFLYGVLLD